MYCGPQSRLGPPCKHIPWNGKDTETFPSLRLLSHNSWNIHQYATKVIAIGDRWISRTPIWRSPDTLQWRYDERDDISDHQPHECLFNSLFRRRSKKLRDIDLCAGNSPVTYYFLKQGRMHLKLSSAKWRLFRHERTVLSLRNGSTQIISYYSVSVFFILLYLITTLLIWSLFLWVQLTIFQHWFGDRWIPAKRASNAENVSIWWRHHETPHIVRHRQTNIIDIPCVFTVVFNVLVVLSSDAVWPLLSWFDMCCIHSCSHGVWQDTHTLLCGNFDVLKCLFPNNAKRMRLEHCLDYITSTVSKT